MTRSDKAFGGIHAYDVSLVCPCKGCDIRGVGCARICESYKKYKFVLTIFNMMRQRNAARTESQQNDAERPHCRMAA